MRGTLRSCRRLFRRCRIIPAHAGNSRPRGGRPARYADHPHACGELEVLGYIRQGVDGSSPRMRGTPSDSHSVSSCLRIIPAHAGNSRPRAPESSALPDHPRACGELPTWSAKKTLAGGSSPRMRGTHTIEDAKQAGLRIIPAHAGNSVRPRRSPCPESDHPRACGELCPTTEITVPGIGSSPRMRGTQGREEARAFIRRIIPAHAGNSVPCSPRSRQPSDHPRACGELASSQRAVPIGIGSSPRMRGTLERTLLRDFLRRIIPAHAGNSPSVNSITPPLPDHPRACGELDRWLPDRADQHRIIPAHAGNSRR